MKKIILLFSLSICYTFTLAQNKAIAGNYFSESGYCLQLKEDSFKLIVRQSTPLMRSSEVWAEGLFTRVNKSFLEFNSYETPAIKVARSMKITQRNVESKNDSIKLKILIPYNMTDLRIEIYTEDINLHEFIYSESNNEMLIPQTKNLSFYITPLHLIPHTADGSFYGIIGFDPLCEFEIKENMNYIEFDLPAINNSFFEQYYIEKDYVRIIGNEIIWKGEVFKK